MIAGATSSSLTINPALFTNAGLYTVTVSNAGGSVISSPAVINVAPKLFGQMIGNTLKLTWPPPFILQFANAVNGPYKDVPGATSPYLYNIATGPQGFFRLRSQPFSLLSSNLPGGFSITCPGMPGCNFIIQAATNLTVWEDLHTNTSSFNFVDTNAWRYPKRFYRAILAH